MSIYDFSARLGTGRDISLGEFKGRVLLIVNTATGCGFTPQYSGLQELYEKHKDEGLEILDFPCNQFGHQAPGTSGEIADFCTGRFGVTFPQFEKIDVNGKNEAPLYGWLKSQKGGVAGSAVKWNFTKFLVDRQGNVAGRFAPTKTPEALESEIMKLL